MNYKQISFYLFMVRRSYCSVDATKFERNPVKKQIVTLKPVKSEIHCCKSNSKGIIDHNTIALLEKLSLVNCANREGIETLEEAITFADKVLEINTEGVQPLITVLEDYPLELREDIAAVVQKENILSNANVIEDDYFVAPPGNIPLEPRTNLLFEKNKEKSVEEI